MASLCYYICHTVSMSALLHRRATTTIGSYVQQDGGGPLFQGAHPSIQQRNAAFTRCSTSSMPPLDDNSLAASPPPPTRSGK